MSETSAVALLERLAALEQQVEDQRGEIERLRAQVQGPLTAPFRVVDDAGGTVLEVAKHTGGVHLRLLDGDGHFLITLQNVAGMGAVTVHGHQGIESVALGVSKHGGNIGISNAAGQLVGWLNVTERGGHVVVRDNEGNIAGNLP